jgi:hypothetical protein
MAGRAISYRTKCNGTHRRKFDEERDRRKPFERVGKSFKSNFMNKRKLFVGTGALILAIVAIFTTRANSKFTAGIYYLTNLGRCKVLTSTINSTFFSTTGTDQATIKTTGGTLETLWASSACTALGGAAYFKGN